MYELRERPYNVKRVPAITADNVDMYLDAVVYLKIVDPYKACYGVDDAVKAMLILAQTTVRSRVGEMTLDQTFKNREEINAHIVSALDRAGSEWGIDCTRFEGAPSAGLDACTPHALVSLSTSPCSHVIPHTSAPRPVLISPGLAPTRLPAVRDIEPPESMMEAMKAEAEAERKKRAVILESEGFRQAQINRAEGEKASAVLASEAARESAINHAHGDADAVRAAATAEAEKMVALARAKAQAVREVAESLQQRGGEEAARLGLASEYVEAFGQLGGRSSTLVVPADAANVPSVLGQAMAAYDGMQAAVSSKAPSAPAAASKSA